MVSKSKSTYITVKYRACIGYALFRASASIPQVAAQGPVSEDDADSQNTPYSS